MNKSLKLLGKTIIYIVLIFITILCLLPLWWMIITALKAPAEVFSYPPKFWPSKIHWANFVTAWNMAPWGRYFFNTAFYTVCTVVGVIVTSVMSGYAFSKLKFKGRNLVFISYIGTMMVPAQVTIIPVYMILSQLHMIDTYAGLIIPGLANAFGCFLMRQFIATIPTEFVESALIDGAGHGKILISIITPLVTPAVAALGIFTFMGSWDNFFWPLVVTNSEKLRVLQVGLASFQSQYGTADWGAMMAAATFVSAPILILFFFAQKYFIEGITMTGIKG
ncbi:ABC-type glycerol-3-phosphate transport system permease component [Pullulanibacillus pueri]|uniref:Sugar ABC transporter permease n=1 Tax=Pullulanibacillus pueri TaxID=1437324 RepID=A0A8J2ZYR9_9BACL|nr:carbohydrate ABC transporter permease [Pullulanibacillus pueri]MBM7683304.1 ABC-type glycerol-3-phosphate transport system permease component [Pullulanibacillus pueri]GGH86451.1 sugar ABC transporter permease [Pullulanibacillus pueri]